MDSRRFLSAITAGTALLCGCAPTTAPSSPPAQTSSGTILVSSSPAPGSTVRGPVNALILSFNPPARLDEVTVTGPDGTMPMMIHALGETDRYSVPLPGFGPGSYRVDWRASAQGQEHRGNIQFTVSG